MALPAPPAAFQVLVATPAGRGAVATVQITGPQALAITAELFQPASGGSLFDRPVRTPVFGFWTFTGTDAREEVVACVFDSQSLHFHCHGGTAAVSAIVESLCRRGGRQELWAAAATRQASDRIAAEARIALAACRTERAALILLDQLHGALRQAIDDLLRFVSGGSAADAVRAIDALLATAPVGRHLTQAWRVVLAGQPNVGKSSLANALAGFGRALVDAVPGTTRDVLAVETATDGWLVELADTAGLRSAHDAVEAAGVLRARAAQAAADLVLLVVDASQPWSADDQQLVDDYPHALLIHNKADLFQSYGTELPISGLLVSALCGTGIAQLLDAIARRLVPNPPVPGSAVVFTSRQVEQLVAARVALEAGDQSQVRRSLDTLVTNEKN